MQRISHCNLLISPCLYSNCIVSAIRAINSEFVGFGSSIAYRIPKSSSRVSTFLSMPPIACRIARSTLLDVVWVLLCDDWIQDLCDCIEHIHTIYRHHNRPQIMIPLNMSRYSDFMQHICHSCLQTFSCFVMSPQSFLFPYRVASVTHFQIRSNTSF